MIEPVTTLDPDVALRQDLAHLYRLLEQGDIEGARAYIKELASKWPDSDRVQHFARVLAPPVARAVTGGTGRSLQRERDWLRLHGREYPGCWLALEGGRLIAADRDPHIVLEAVDKDIHQVDPLFVRAPEPPA